MDPSAASPENALQHSEERFRLLVDAVQDCALFMLDTAGRVVSWNSGARRIKGYDEAEIIGRHFSIFYPAESVASGWPDEELRIARERGRLEDEGWRIRKNGSRFFANVVITPVRDDQGTLLGYAKVTRDMSESKRLAELENSSRRMTEFLSMLAHELRNPLAPMRNAVSLMQLQEIEQPNLRHGRDVIDRQLTHLTRLVDDLLDVGRIATGKILLRKQAISFREVLMLAIEAARPLVESRGHHLTTDLPDDPVEMLGDSARLVQAVHNLLGNAAKYTAPGGHIHLAVRLEAQAVSVEITDTGRGISPEALPRVFDLFVQETHSTLPGENGLGVGLTLARSVAEMHGGTVAAESPGVGQGSTFTLRLPRTESAHPGVQEDAALVAVPEGGEWRTLVIDDNQDAADSMVAMLDVLGHRACAAYGGDLGLIEAMNFKPHLVLLDLNMPGVDGFTVLRRLKDMPPLARTYFAAVTGYGRQEDIARSLEAGFDLHLTKPISVDQVLAAIQAAARAQSPRKRQSLG
jgi:PAS domain S-box-containing protein